MKSLRQSTDNRILKSCKSSTSRSGMALVLVLAMLVLVTGLVMAVFQLVRTDSASSSAYERGTSTRMLADTAVNLVIGQIQEATQRPGEAWTSQPGVIRTFNTSGQPTRAYKLYSAPTLTVPGAFNPVDLADLPPDPSSWRTKPNEWVDLNQPIVTTQTDSDGNLLESFVFPIVDPRAYTPDTPEDSLVEGFSYDTDWASETTSSQSVAMPVRWLYLLQDGRLVPGEPTGSGDSVNIEGMTSANPAIARLAFWTDDESSKLNINTAADGTPWDTPVANTSPVGATYTTAGLSTRPDTWGRNFFEADFAHFQPSQGEYQRYPGHPATTSLSPVLYNSIAATLGISPATATFEEHRNILERIYSIAPRVTGGAASSQAGTKRGSGILTLQSGRLFASLDELLFSESVSGTTRDENPLDIDSDERKTLIEQSKFFLTAHSRAPEVTLSNKPRVVAWPVHVNDAPTHRSAFDRLIAFCGTVGSGADAKAYYFTRQNPLSPTDDWSVRNQQLFSYLQQLTSANIPGFGGNLQAKWTTSGVSDRDQILMQAYDYIRILNLQDRTVTQPYADYPALSAAERDAIRGMVVPTIVSAGPGAGSRGFGRFPTISELAFIFITRSGDSASTTTPKNLQLMLVPELFTPATGWSVMATNLQIKFTEIDIRINGQSVRNGADTSPKGSPVGVEFRPNGSLVSESNPVLMSAAHVPRSAAAPGSPGSQHGHSRLGGHMAPGIMMFQSTRSGNTLAHYKRDIPISEEFSHPNIISTQDGGRDTSMDRLFIEAGSKVSFTVETTAGGDPVVLQRFEYTFPAEVELQAPRTRNTSGPIAFGTRIGRAVGPNPGGLVEAGDGVRDTVFSLVPAGGSIDLKGDYRLIAASENIGDYFGVIEGAEGTRGSVTDSQSVHTLRSNYVQSPKGFRFGNLVQGVSQYPSSVQMPDVPPGIDGVTNHMGNPGDWDNGVGFQTDGAYINKADEGTSQSMQSEKHIPYIGFIDSIDVTENLESTLFSPNRQMPSAVMFGSLPTGVKRGLPWQTLLFRPALASLPGGTNHPGAKDQPVAGALPDHLLLDNFWMPVVEPYAISEPFSTAGKVNLNYQIAPFTYIQRDTGIRGILRPVRITAMDPTQAISTGGSFVERYKTGATINNPSAKGAEGISIRKEIDEDATLEFFQERFASGHPFISESEICEIPLVPKGIVSPGANLDAIKTALSTFWASHKLTGDNSLERPYSHIYPRVTTKSNTFTVHVRAQRLQVSQSALQTGQFDTSRGAVTGEFVGAFTIERFLDPNSDGLVKDDGSGGLIGAGENDANAFLGPYKFRILNTRQLSF